MENGLLPPETRLHSVDQDSLALQVDVVNSEKGRFGNTESVVVHEAEQGQISCTGDDRKEDTDLFLGEVPGDIDVGRRFGHGSFDEGALFTQKAQWVFKSLRTGPEVIGAQS